MEETRRPFFWNVQHYEVWALHRVAKEELSLVRIVGEFISRSYRACKTCTEVLFS